MCLNVSIKKSEDVSKAVSIFPSKESYLRLIATYLMEYTEYWEIERSDI